MKKIELTTVKTQIWFKILDKKTQWYLGSNGIDWQFFSRKNAVRELARARYKKKSNYEIYKVQTFTVEYTEKA